MVENVTKKNLSENISNQTGISYSQTSHIVDDLFDFIVQITDEEGSLVIPQFGKFQTRKKKARSGRNPKTKEEFKIEEREVLTFNCSEVLKEFING
ncbi:MAG: integration host factor subunit alpha [Rickettsiales bacterium]|jgi:integration host factor subunit alpha|nr:integration host factor subunit alpha [Rickettsiales bacterium]